MRLHSTRRLCALPVWTAVLLSSAGCHGCSARPAASHARAPAPTASIPLLPAARARAVAPPRFLDLDSPRGVSLPTGCRLDLPVRRAALPDPTVRFVAVPGALDALALAVPGTGRTLARRGLIDLDARTSIDLPWSRLGTPPVLGRSSRGWVGALARPAASGLQRAVLWRQWTRPESLLEGDQLDVADLECDGDRCALLTSLVRRTAAPGATLLIGHVDQPAGTWMRTDIEADPAVDWRPYSLPGFDAASQSGWVALTSPNALELWHVQAGRATRGDRIATPFGLYDVTLAGQPLVGQPLAGQLLAIAPGQRSSAPCIMDQFPLAILRTGAMPQRIVTQTPPASVIARNIGGGAIVMWVAPASCRDQTSLVSAVLLDSAGHPTSSPMAVEQANGFALTTRGDKLSLWLRDPAGLTWIRGTCTPGNNK